MKILDNEINLIQDKDKSNNIIQVQFEITSQKALFPSRFHFFW